MDTTPIVIDIGSGFCKAGFAGEKSPRTIFPTIIGTPRHQGFFIGKKSQDSYAGNQAISKIGILNVQYPIKSGFIMNWNDMSKILSYTYEEELHSNSNEHPILLTESIKSDQKQRENMLQVIFETFQGPSFCACKQPFLSIYSVGCNSGISIDIGQEITQIVPILECKPVQSGTTCLNFGGINLTNLFLRALKDRGFSLSIITGLMIASEIKEKYGYVALDYQKELEQNKNSHKCDVSYQSQDGDEFKVSDERFKVPEILFNPQFGDYDFPSIPKAAYDSVMNCDASIRSQLFNNIVLCGGSSMFDGFTERFEQEIKQIVDPSTEINVIAPQNRAFAAWIGGSLFASSSDFDSALVSKAEYEEQGKEVISKLNL